jgi:hypothetical protein
MGTNRPATTRDRRHLDDEFTKDAEFLIRATPAISSMLINQPARSN